MATKRIINPKKLVPTPTVGRERSSDTVRPSRDGHEFHEAWTARKAMQLLLPTDGLIGIAVEGLSEVDQAQASPDAVEIADLTVYYGKDATFRDANRVETLQFKYSPKRAQKQFRASDAKQTIEKFAASYRDHQKNHGAAAVAQRLRFELITNRPVFAPLQTAIELLAERRRPTGPAGRQAQQFEKAAGLTGEILAEFAGKCRITGGAGTLWDTKAGLSRMLVDWSATTDARAQARLGEMRDMVRRKAGHDAQHQKVIRQVDVLNALGLSETAELLPCPSRLPRVGDVLDREQLAEAAALVPTLTQPLVIHADGGVGKTVFLGRLAATLSNRHEVVFFDCFGGGAYRAPEDGRHLPGRGLVHLNNELACRGLCDPILPDSNNTETLFRTFRRRLQQCVTTLEAGSPGRLLVLFIDAIDNAAEYASERRQDAFPALLLNSFHISGSVPGVRIVASGRTHRISKCLDPSCYLDFELRTFSFAETRAYLSARLSDLTDIEIRVAQSRSGGNGRVLEHLASGGRAMLAPSELEKPIILNDLLRQRISTALTEAQKQGHGRREIGAFLAGLSALPPPVPLEEYAGAQGMSIGAIRSFASDLAPLLDRTPEGVTFRDEPTETLVRETYGANDRALKRVATNLLARQNESVYAARALPGLLLRLGEGKKLFELAFDDHFPAAMNGTVGQRRIRYSRLKAAVLHAASVGDKDKLVRLLVELSSVAASDQKGADYIQENPDLVVNARDVDALRRLFETRTKWPGARHSRLTVASVLSGDLDEGARYFQNALAWVRRELENPPESTYGRAPKPGHIDHAAIGLFRLAQGEHQRAISFMKTWRPWYSFELCEYMFDLWRQCVDRRPDLRSHGQRLLDGLKNETGPLAAALCFATCSENQRHRLIERLAKSCKRSKDLAFSGRLVESRSYELSDGLRKAAAIALSRGMARQAMEISQRASHVPPNIWVMNGDRSQSDVFGFLFHAGLKSAATGAAIHERDLLPSDLLSFAKGLGRAHHGEFRNALKQRVTRAIQKHRETKEPDKALHDGLSADADRFLGRRLPRFLELARALAAFLGAPRRHADRPFRALVHVLARLRKPEDGYYDEREFNHFFQSLGTTIVLFALWSRDDLGTASVRALLKHLHEQPHVAPSTLIRIIAIIARRPRFDLLAGEQAVQAKTLIEREDDVTTRSGLFADLARAILPVSPTDATDYFKVGLEQLDAIGSSDYDFTNELLLFASSVRGGELSEKDAHTLTNICELNMYDADKFAWVTFAEAMSRVLGARSLAKISRWNDRGKAGLDYTLLPCLTSLVRSSKIGLEEAIALNRLATPAELWACNTEAFAKAIHEKRPLNERTLVVEVIRQFEENHPGLTSETIVAALTTLARDVLGSDDATTRYLENVSRRSDTGEAKSGPSTTIVAPQAQRRRLARETQRARARMATLAAATNPFDQTALEKGATLLRSSPMLREVEGEFFGKLRRKVRHADRQKYLSIIARLEQFDIYAKCNELERCKKAWSHSSAGLASFYRDLAAPLLDVHADDLLNFERLSGYHLRQVSDITNVPVAALTIEFTKTLAASDRAVPAAAWLGLATIVNEDAHAGHAQKALTRVLNSGTARLTDAAQDGPWKRGLYPPADITDIAVGLVWQALGSPRAADRWQAAHSVRCFAQFGRWNVVDALVDKIESRGSESFGAAELRFFDLHAKLWLLIAVARVAHDWPAQIAKHSTRLMSLAEDRTHPHALMRHFAAQALLACEEGGALQLSPAQRRELEDINESPLPHRRAALEYRAGSGFYQGRPSGVADPPVGFRLEYDFDKHEVHGLAEVFAQPGWRVHDRVKAEVERLDPNATSMFDTGGRDRPYRAGHGLDSGVHVYGQYLAWHALHFTAADLLRHHPITEDWKHGRRWSEWLSRGLLTRKDGLWLSDGMDRPPASTRQNLLEKRKEGTVLTGDRDKLMALIGIESRSIRRDLVVRGDWKSPDAIDVHINSALVPASSGRKLTKALVDQEDAFSIGLPQLDAEEELRFWTEMREYTPWIVQPSTERGSLEEWD